MKVFNKKILSSQVSMLMTLTICLGLPRSHASDVEIYSAGTPGETTLMLAIDTSRSMEEADDATTTYDDYKGVAGWNNSSACKFGDYEGNAPSITRNFTGSVTTKNTVQIPRSGGEYFSMKNTRSVEIELRTVNGISYERKYCKSGTRKYYDRLTLVKDGLFDLLNGNTANNISPISDDKIVGLSTFSNNLQTNKTIHRGGSIVVPARRLDTVVNSKTQRQILMEAVAALDIDGSGGTPSSYLYAETVAYLMGLSTMPSSNKAKEMYRFNRTTRGWQECKTAIDTGASSGFLQKCGDNDWKTFDRENMTFSRVSRNFYINEIFRPVRSDETWDYYVLQNASNKSGFFNSKFDTKSEDGVTYSAPTSITKQSGWTDSQKQCSGQGIYFLTDGAATQTNDVNSLSLMQAALGSKGSTFSCSNSYYDITKSKSNSNPDFPTASSNASWACINKFAQTLLDPTKNPAGIKIRTAVVGFAKDFDGINDYDKKDLSNESFRKANYDAIGNTNTDVRNTARWGIIGQGGWYQGNTSGDVVNSVNNFLTQIERTIPSVTTGSPLIPIDQLNPIGIQPDGYYTTFSPKPNDSVSLWTGNLNKYKVLNGQLYGSSNPLFNSDGSVDETVNGLWASGVVGQLKLKHEGTTSPYKTQRTVFTNRNLVLDNSNTYQGSSSNSLVEIDLNALMDNTKFGNDPKKNYWLNLLGFQVPTTGNLTLQNIINAPELRQIGAVMHSTPLLLTQEGKITAINGVVATSDREDYLLFGTTQGLLHVVDKDGKEVFAFVPNEMMENQTTAMANAGSTGGSVNTLFYGIDAPWTAYTQYVSKTVNGSTIMTIKDSGRLSNEDNDKSATLKGEQWVYGGLRMGGKSYYALDLTDINNPKLKFHIDPENAAATNPIQFMGQSWSKPTIGFVNWEGERKRVMFVGGGYDPNYENRLYQPSNNTIDHGAGVYMFSASGDDAGSLLWWSSANTDPSIDPDKPQFTQNTNLKYSVPSQINALDRDGDGLIDNLYFGDLGGQVFRVDLNNNDSMNFGHRVTLMYSAHTNDGRSPRFYEMPSISIHADDKGAYGIAALSSGNRSSPLAGSQSDTLNDSAQDGVFVIFDHDLGKSDLYKSTFTATSTEALSVLNPLIGVERHKIVEDTTTKKDVIKYYRGWRHNFAADAVSGAYKGTNEIYALDNMLYVNVYERDGTGIGGKCGAGVKGDSHLFQYCLPTGKCNFYTDTSNVPYRVKLGAGILGAGVGLGYDNDNKKLGLVIAKSRDSSFCAEPANKHKPECQLFNTKIGLQQLRWYED